MVDQIIKNFNESIKNFNQSEKSVVWKNHQLNKFSNINEEKLRNFRSNGLVRGVDNSYLKKNSFFSLKDLNECFTEFNTSFNEIKKYCYKKNIGNSKDIINYKGFYIGESIFRNFAIFNELKKFIFLKADIKVICEIGGGIGDLARIVLLQEPKTKYFLIDLPEMNLLSHYFLQNTFPEKKIFSYIDIKNNSITSSDLNNFDIFILPPNLNYQDIKFDLFININSMQEMKKKIIKKYFDFIHSHIKTDGYFYNANRFYYDGTNEKNILSEYPYKIDKWNIVYSGPYKTSRRSYVIISQKTENKDANFKQKIEKIKILEKNFTPPGIPLLFIKFYRYLKNFFK